MEINSGRTANETVFEVMEENSGFVDGYQPAKALGDHAAEEDTLAWVEERSVAEAVDADEEVYEYAVLVNRYKTAEGKNLEEYVSSWEEYYDLCYNVQKAAESLAYNYNEYLEYRDFYDVKIPTSGS